MAVSFIICFITGIFKFPGITNYFRIIYMTISASQMARIHDWSGFIMGLTVLIHLIVHWKWIVVMTKNIFKKNE